MKTAITAASPKMSAADIRPAPAPRAGRRRLRTPPEARRKRLGRTSVRDLQLGENGAKLRLDIVDIGKETAARAGQELVDREHAEPRDRRVVKQARLDRREDSGVWPQPFHPQRRSARKLRAVELAEDAVDRPGAELAFPWARELRNAPGIARFEAVADPTIGFCTCSAAFQPGTGMNKCCHAPDVRERPINGASTPAGHTLKLP